MYLDKEGLEIFLENYTKQIFERHNPVGTVIHTYKKGNPVEWLKFGTWELIPEDRVLISAAEDGDAGVESGSKTAELPAHQHQVGAHVHALNLAGYALAASVGNNFDAFRVGGIPSFSTNHRQVVTTSLVTGSNHTVGTGLAGATGAMSAPTNTTNPIAEHEISVMQPSESCYIWKRVA